MRRLRGGLIGAIVAQRHGVLCLAPDYAPSDATALDATGARREQLAPPPPGLMLFPERIAIAKLTEQLVEWRPHIVLAYGQDMALRAVKAARSAKVERIVALVTGLPPPGESRGLKTIARTLELTDSAVFHNGDDPKYLRARKLLPADLSYIVVPGAGVDLAYHAAQPLPPLNARTRRRACSTIAKLPGW
jgi:hypothetical protein